MLVFIAFIPSFVQCSDIQKSMNFITFFRGYIYIYISHICHDYSNECSEEGYNGLPDMKKMTRGHVCLVNQGTT